MPAIMEGDFEFISSAVSQTTEEEGFAGNRKRRAALATRRSIKNQA